MSAQIMISYFTILVWKGGAPLLPIEERKRIAPLSAEQHDPPPKRQHMARISSVLAAQDSWLPQPSYYSQMKSISATIAASRSPPPAPEVFPQADSTACSDSARITGTCPPGPVSKQFETATDRMKFSAEWKGPLRRPRKHCFNDDVRLER